MINNFDCFYEKIKEEKLPIHGIIVSSKDRKIVEHYYAPFDKMTLHRMYSVTKTFVMLAIGLLVTQKKVKISDKIYEYFDFNDLSPEIRETTIEDLLTMKTPYLSTTYKRSTKGYLESFFEVKPEKSPGTNFAYDTSASYTLTAIVEKITKMPLLEYLKEEFLNDLGFSKESYIKKSPEGISNGGSSLVSTLDDLNKVGHFIKNLGSIKGKQIIDKEYMQNSISYQSSTFLATEGTDFKKGYGYQIWKNRYNGFTMFGMGGQLFYYNPVLDVSLCVIADLQSIPSGTQKIIDMFNNYLEKIDIEHVMFNKITYGMLFSENKQEVSDFNQIYHGEEDIILSLKNNEGHIIIGNNVIDFSTKTYKEGILSSQYPYIAQAILSDKRLSLTVYLIGDELGTILFDIYYDEKMISIYSKAYAENILNDWNLNITGKRT